MPYAKARVLVVDDKESIRTTISLLLDEMGYEVRTANDGFSALREIRLESPAILLSDLNMPRMSGFELLVAVRRRFPEIQVVAMSGSYAGFEVPSGVLADAFYQKGSSIFGLLQILGALPRMQRRAPVPSRTESPQWIERKGNDPAGEGCVMVTCPDCLRGFSQPLTGFGGLTCEATCIRCGNPIQYAVVEPSNQIPTPALRSVANAAIAVQAEATLSN